MAGFCVRRAKELNPYCQVQSLTSTSASGIRLTASSGKRCGQELTRSTDRTLRAMRNVRVACIVLQSARCPGLGGREPGRPMHGDRTAPTTASLSDLAILSVASSKRSSCAQCGQSCYLALRRQLHARLHVPRNATFRRDTSTYRCLTRRGCLVAAQSRLDLVIMLRLSRGSIYSLPIRLVVKSMSCLETSNPDHPLPLSLFSASHHLCFKTVAID